MRNCMTNGPRKLEIGAFFVKLCETLSSATAPHTWTRLGVKLVQGRQKQKRENTTAP